VSVGYGDLFRNFYFDWNGVEITQERWIELRGSDVHVAEDFFHSDTVPGVIHVSTVWVGLDMRVGRHGAPVIFETMAFFDRRWNEEETDRYCTLAQAKTGHRRMVEMIDAKHGPLTRLQAPDTAAALGLLLGDKLDEDGSDDE
jgi:hypothetical protein